MEKRKKESESRLIKWSQLMEQREESGQNAKEFCEAKGISKSKYQYWRRKLKEAECVKIPEISSKDASIPEGWSQVKPAKTDDLVKEGLTIEIRGSRVNVYENTKIELLERVCRMLKAL